MVVPPFTKLMVTVPKLTVPAGLLTTTARAILPPLVLMTALAMIIGMVPMALGLGDGGEQNAPLGRAVIGGLLCATVATLVFVPSVFALLHGRGRGDDTEALFEKEGQKTYA